MLLLCAVLGSSQASDAPEELVAHLIPHSHCDPGWLDTFEVPSFALCSALLSCCGSPPLLRHHCTCLDSSTTRVMSTASWTVWWRSWQRTSPRSLYGPKCRSSCDGMKTNLRYSFTPSQLVHHTCSARLLMLLLRAHRHRHAAQSIRDSFAGMVKSGQIEFVGGGWVQVGISAVSSLQTSERVPSLATLSFRMMKPHPTMLMSLTKSLRATNTCTSYATPTPTPPRAVCCLLVSSTPTVAHQLANACRLLWTGPRQLHSVRQEASLWVAD